MNAVTTPDIYQDGNGWWWPAADTQARHVIMSDCAPSIAELLKHLNDDRRAIVQAGANVGMYPIALTDHFAQVHTFEPDPVNWACLVKNVSARDSLRRISMHNAALGAELGQCRPVAVEASNCGAHRVDFGSGDVRATTIDGLGLAACDCIWLDIEGAETIALRGAIRTIERFSPIIAAEDKGLDQRFFSAEPGALQAFLEPLGYEQVAAIGRDKVFKRRNA